MQAPLGLTWQSNSWEHEPLNLTVLAIYSSNRDKTQRLLSWSYFLKTTGCRCLCLPPLVCFRSDVIRKEYSPGLTCMSSIGSNLSVCVLWAVTKTMIMVIFNVSCFKVSSLISGYPLRWLSTICGSQVSAYLGKVGFLLKTPDMNLEIKGCSPA